MDEEDIDDEDCKIFEWYLEFQGVWDEYVYGCY